MKRARAALLVAGLFSMLNGCALFHHKKQGPSVDLGPRRVGTVAVVNEDLRFVLLDVGTLYLPMKGQALKTFRGSAESGILAVTGERQSPFIAADIVKGTPQRGDDVVQ